MKSNQTHAFIQIGKDIKADKIPSLVLLCGVEEYLVNFYVNTLLDKYIDKSSEALDLVTLYRERLTTENIMENLETIPLMSQRKVVFVPDFFDNHGKIPKTFQDDSSEMDRLTDYISRIGNMDGVLLLMTFAKQEDSRSEANVYKSKLFKTITAATKKSNENKTKLPCAAIYNFEALNDGQLYAFIEKRLHASDKQFKQSIVSLIAREVGYGNNSIDYGLFNLDNDIRKIIAHCGETEEIKQADVLSVITLNPENSIIAMIDAVGKNRKDEAFKLIHNLLQNGRNELEILGSITRQLEFMLRTCEMRDTGLPLSQIQKILQKEKIHTYRTQKGLEAGSRFGSKGLKNILSLAYEVEVNIKSGLMPGPLALEYFIARI